MGELMLPEQLFILNFLPLNNIHSGVSNTSLCYYINVLDLQKPPFGQHNFIYSAAQACIDREL